MAKGPLQIETIKHDAAKRLNIPTAEYESVMRDEDRSPVQVAYQRRNRDLDPQLVWRGKDEQDWSDLVVSAPPLYIQEKVHPKVLIDDLKRETKELRKEDIGATVDLFADFNGLPDKEAATEFYQHDQHWSNRMISGDSLAVMASLTEREGLRGKVQCIYFDPPYGIKFNSNFQWSTSGRDKIKEGAPESMTREPEQIRAFRDTWKDEIHSYLTYLRDRLTAARDLLSDSGSIFIQIGDENVHYVRNLMDEIFGSANLVSQIAFKTTTGRGGSFLASASNYILWFAKDISKLKYRPLYTEKAQASSTDQVYSLLKNSSGQVRRITKEEKANKLLVDSDWRLFRPDNITSQSGSDKSNFLFQFRGKSYSPGKRFWSTSITGMKRLEKADRIYQTAATSIQYVRYFDDFPVNSLSNVWTDTGTGSFTEDKIYVVQTSTKVVERCLLMATDPGDIVLDPTCGSGTAAVVSEQWGRRWITIDTSRVSIALARSRLMGAKFSYYILADSIEGQKKEAEISRSAPRTIPTRCDIRQGFVYERVSRINLKSIPNNSEIDEIWEKWQRTLEPLRHTLNQITLSSFEEWEIPWEAHPKWSVEAKNIHSDWWNARISRQKEIDASVSAKADFEYLFDKPYIDNSRVRVAGPFTVESLSPHRTFAVGANDELIDTLEASEGKRVASERDAKVHDFAQMILENLKAAGVQQAHKDSRITFTGISGWPGHFICAEGLYMEGEQQRRAGIFIGPEFGTVSRPDLVAAAREAGDAGFDVLIACAFNYDAHSAEFDKLGRVPVLKARMNPDLLMAKDLKTTGTGNLFVVFGEPDIQIEDAGDNMIRVKVFGVDVFKPQTGEIIAEGTDGIALWMLDTDYNEESFFVRHAYFLGANDPYKALKATLKAEIDEAAWESLYSDVSRPFPKPKSGRIAVKVINHLGDEVMKVFGV